MFHQRLFLGEKPQNGIEKKTSNGLLFKVPAKLVFYLFLEHQQKYKSQSYH